MVGEGGGGGRGEGISVINAINAKLFGTSICLARPPMSSNLMASVAGVVVDCWSSKVKVVLPSMWYHTGENVECEGSPNALVIFRSYKS